MNEKIYEDLFKNVVINGHYSFEKLNEMKSYIKTLNIKIDNLEQQVKKQQEVINKATNILKKGLNELDTRKREEVYIEEYIENALDILKEVSE